jgi:hypothetical protein
MRKKTFCINCFEDENIKKFIKENGTPIEDENYECVFCQTYDPYHDEKYEILSYESKKHSKIVSKNQYIISQGLLNQKIIKIINEHYEFIDNPKIKDGLVDILSILDNLFEDKTGVLLRLSKYQYIKYKNYPFSESDYKTYTNSSKQDWTSQENHWLLCWKPEKYFNWKKFKEHTKHKARFFDHEKNSFKVREELNLFIPIFEGLENCISSKNIFRARESNKELKDTLKISSKKIQATELGKAPTRIVKNNRFSPIGISYGYFSFDKKTALSEIRAEIGQEIAMGEFTLENDLKLIDFTKKYIFTSYLSKQNTNPFNENFNILLRDISSLYSFISDISKPILANDTLLEYVPTQIMSEYIWSLGYDGFIFDSSQQENGENIILFDYKPSYKDYEILKIKTKNIEFDTL